MDEARKVLERLERIESLDRGPAARPALLAELRALVAESEAWARAEPVLPERTLDAVARTQEVVVPLG
ncbi:MAG: hypothetical protein QOH73_2163 [Gaiellaceae bacterium]|jgi:hypothetical protein|nr:hypothetical protein [Gaiellaceae bacterium]